MPDDPRVQELLDELLDRQTTPEDVCGACVELLPVVRERWQQICRARAELDTLLPTGLDRGLPTLPPEEPPLPAVPGYAVEAVLGHGGMGVVYKARHLRLNRVVALKMTLAGSYAGPRERERFQREAEAVAGLRHPNVVQVYDVGDADGRPYFTMEYVEGGSLAQKLAGTPQPARAAAALAATLAEAVQVAHRGGIVHRDLKPGNVLLTADGTPKISDFGLARRVEGGTEFTLTGTRLGTPSYMAPEQALGKTSTVGPPVDIYALGAILYELLTGRPPFRAETAAETERQVVSEDPAPPSRLNTKVPRDLETICLKCLHKSPARRYDSAQELAEDLRRFLDGKPVRARPVGVAERAVKWARQRPAAALLVVTLLTLSGAAAGAGLWLRQQEMDRRAAKMHQAERAQDAIKTALKRAHDLRREERWPEALLVLTEASTHLTDADSPPLEERLGQARSDFQFAADLERIRANSPLEPDPFFYYRRRKEEFGKAFERAGLKVGDDPGAVAASIRSSAIREQLVAAVEDWALAASMTQDEPSVKRLLKVARLADPEPRWRNRFRDGAIWFSRGKLLGLADAAFNTTPPPTGHQLALLGLLLRRAGAQGQSTQLLAEACRRQPSSFWLNREMGAALLAEGRNLESAAYYRAALALRPDSAGVHEGLGSALFNARQMDDALAAYRRAVELSSPATFSNRGFLVGPLADTGRWAEAADECRRVLDAHPTDCRLLLRLGVALWENQKDEDAILILQKAVGTGTRDDRVYLCLGQAHSRMGRHEEAVTALRRATELCPMERKARWLLSRELHVIGRPEEAIAELQRAIDRPSTMGTFHTELGTLLRAQGRPEEAAAAFRKAADLDHQLAAAWHGLAAALLDRSRFAEARLAIERLLKLPATDSARRAQRRQLDLCDRLLASEDLPAVLAGQKRPAEVTTQRALAEWCLKHGRRPAAAARWYAAVFLAQPSLVDDLEAGNRFDAACAAALAGCGVGEDAAKLEDGGRAALRRQALDWLTAEHTAWAERHRRGKPGDRTVAATSVRSWQGNEYLAGVRDGQALARLPLEERRAWQTFWAGVATLAARDPAALFDRARTHVGRGEWREAAACYAEALDLENTDDGEIWFEYAATQLLTGDRPGYRRTCEHLLARSREPLMRPSLVARACTLAPRSVDDSRQWEQLSAAELEQNPTDSWSFAEQAALRLRAGWGQEPVRLAGRAIAADGRPGRAVVSWLWLALAYRQLGQAAEARRWLDRAAGWLDQQKGRMPLNTKTIGMHRHDWLEAHVLRQEAKALLR